MISFDSSIGGGIEATPDEEFLFLNVGIYLSKGDNGEFGGMLPFDEVVVLLSDPIDVIDLASSPEYSAESVVESPVSDRGGEITGEDASELGGDIDSSLLEENFALCAFSISTLASAEDNARGKAFGFMGPSHRPQNKPLSPCASFSSKSSSIKRIFSSSSSSSSSFGILSFWLGDGARGDFNATKSSATEWE